MQPTLEPAYIVSTFQHINPTEDSKAHQKQLKLLKKSPLAYKPLKGKYEDKREDSIFIQGPLAEAYALSVLHQFNQDSILYLDADRNATFIFKDGKRTRAGRLKAVSKSRALASDAYSYCPKTLTYYIIE